MKHLSIKLKVPLLFGIIIVLTFLFSIILLSYVTHKKLESTQINHLQRYAIENTYNVLVKDHAALNKTINDLKHTETFKSVFKNIYFVDFSFHIIGSSFPEKIGSLPKTFEGKKSAAILTTHSYNNFVQLTNDTYYIPIKAGNITLGYLGAEHRNSNILKIINSVDNEIKNTVFFIFIFGSTLILLSSFYLSNKIVSPITDIIEYINNSLMSDPQNMDFLPIEHIPNQRKNSSCEHAGTTGPGHLCWEQFINERSHKNPVMIPCFECSLFLVNEGDELHQLKLFLNQLIFTTKVHYKKNKHYSSTLENLVSKRTKTLLTETQKSNLIIENMAEGVLVTDLKGNLIQINNNAKELLDIQNQKSILNHNIKEILTNTTSKTAMLGLIKKTVKTEDLSTKTIRLVIDGKEQHLVLKATLVQGNEPMHQLIICLIEDITHIKQLDRFKNDFFQALSHDLKNPLTSIMGFLDVLLNDPTLSTNQHKYLSLALSNSIELQTLIQNIANLIKQQSATITLKPEPFKIVDFYEDVQESYIPQMKEHRIKCVLDIKPKNLEITADYFRMKQAFSNLVSNAIKASADITITLSAHQGNEELILKVTDTGPGIPNDKLPYLFNKFTQLNTYKESGEGLGLGLTIVKSIITLHNGTIDVESQLGQGTTFTLHLPVK